MLVSRLPLLGLALLLSGCFTVQQVVAQDQAAPMSPSPSPTPSARTAQVTEPIFPLPGGLDAVEVFNSNSPEIVQETGILLSTLPQRAPGDASVFLDYPFSGRFALFSHHLVRDPRPTERRLFVGLLASNLGRRPVTLTVASGATFLTQPDAPFILLPAVAPDPDGRVFAGPGDRTTTELTHGRSSVPASRVTIAPNQAQLVYSLPIPANTAGDTPANGRSTMLELTASGPVHLTEVAYFAPRTGDGLFRVPGFADYQAVVSQRMLAGRREAPASFYEPGWPTPEAFRYGRVCGVSRGNTWTGELFGDGTPLPAPGERVGFPIAALYINRFNTGQVQSAPMIRRYRDTAVQSQGNYGVTYALSMHLSNPDASPRLYTLTLSNPASVTGERATACAVYQDPPDVQVMFRGTVRTDLRAQGRAQTHYAHLVLHRGEDVGPFETLSVPPHGRLDVKVSLKYPADATPPQLLTIGRVAL